MKRIRAISRPRKAESYELDFWLGVKLDIWLGPCTDFHVDAEGGAINMPLRCNIEFLREKGT
ncbi:MAG TPA: hypothetical protein HPP77_10170 [Candidatus Hydrogenedentes bacterium]|nr:hypothetical protein [Candidatus Hydrogenedentota bacterium]HIJ74772.1 hypothetical protein [Candidatus Hydrogenedentota bacterium]